MREGASASYPRVPSQRFTPLADRPGCAQGALNAGKRLQLPPAAGEGSGAPRTSRLPPLRPLLAPAAGALLISHPRLAEEGAEFFHRKVLLVTSFGDGQPTRALVLNSPIGLRLAAALADEPPPERAAEPKPARRADRRAAARAARSSRFNAVAARAAGAAAAAPAAAAAAGAAAARSSAFRAAQAAAVADQQVLDDFAAIEADTAAWSVASVVAVADEDSDGEDDSDFSGQHDDGGGGGSEGGAAYDHQWLEQALLAFDLFARDCPDEHDQ